MTKNHSSRWIIPEPATPIALQEYLKKQEEEENREFRGFILKETDTPPVQRLNIWHFENNAFAYTLEPLSVQEINDDAAADTTARAALQGRHSLYYGPATLGGNKKLILISRPGNRLIVRGKMSHFGGSADTGMSPTEGLALVSKNNFKEVVQLHQNNITESGGKKSLFVDVSEPVKPLGHNLNPEAYYLAMRWRDYGLTRAMLHHPQTVVTVANALSGVEFRATPVDFGPAAWTNRIADLSPGLENALQLKTDKECIVTITLAPTISPTTYNIGSDYKKNLVSITSRQFTLFGGYSETEDPLLSQVGLYWKAVDTNVHPISQAWSAAFISWCIKEAGATTSEFKFSGLHAEYVQQAIAYPNAAFEGLDIQDNKAAPDLGDIINHNRKDGVITFNDAKTKNDFFSHSAIVVEKGEDSNGLYVRTIGGNEETSEHREGTVGDSIVRLDTNGKIKQRANYKFIALIKTLK